MTLTTDANRIITIPIEVDDHSDVGYTFNNYKFTELGITDDDVNHKYGNIGNFHSITKSDGELN
ncbi:hypothetical protein [Haloplasma contractile]|uniref:Uncharacterized protein n=1 Tax=Haloplasma contractile SSD-17B TaxID=1033810 RepID=U2E9H1_9MOLU|nr:hypothetical protein [Haloplasma contractile]ERJ11793.1 hypothetical protein HLPCO_002032 [Haloplasma contractile SSD-17B]